jgi:hypothetical protein
MAYLGQLGPTAILLMAHGSVTQSKLTPGGLAPKKYPYETTTHPIFFLITRKVFFYQKMYKNLFFLGPLPIEMAFLGQLGHTAVFISQNSPSCRGEPPKKYPQVTTYHPIL